MLFTPESFTFFMSELQKLDRLFQTPHAASYAARDTAHPKSHRSDDQQKPNRHCSVQRILDAHYSKIDEELRAALANGEPILQQMLDIHSQQAEIGIASKINSVQNQNDSLSDTYESLRQQLQDNADSFKKRIDAFPAELKQQLDDERKQQEDMITEECLIHQQDFRNAFSAKKEAPRTVHHSQLTAEEQAFLRAFPPNNYMAEYVRIYNLEPEYAAYSCCKAIPENFHICTMEYPLKDLGLSTRAVEFLQLHYPYMIRGNMLCMPYSIPFDKSFNHFFRFHKGNRGQAEKDASAQGMRLLTMIPPGKVRLTLIDPVKLGSTFVILNQVVSPADGARELITERVWCSASDIEKQLNEVSIHISNIFSRCLSGKYQNLCDYNRRAAQNAEAYRVLILMDFPAGMTKESLLLLEKILTLGPACGVFVLAYSEAEAHPLPTKNSEETILIERIKKHFSQVCFDLGANKTMRFAGHKFREKAILWNPHVLPPPESLRNTIEVLKAGLANIAPGPVNIDRILDDDIKCSCAENIKIPIGLCGADALNLTLGEDNCQHALLTGMGNNAKDALLHTIMYTLMHRYDPDELQIWLVDFKKGINFKIYAEYQLPSFRVLAIESERELGCSVLQALEAEQRRRADLFSKERVSTYAEYRGQGKNLPRIVLIMDEFHELFAGYNDKVCRDSSSYITQLAHKTTDLGIHMIMASQNYTSIRNLDSTVYTQFPVRIVLKCARSNADILLDNGTDLISQIPRHDTGMAIYNASAGENSSSTYFRIAAIDPRNYRDYLNRINQRYQNHHGWDEQSSIFVPNVSDHTFSIFNQFSGYKPEQCPVRGRLYLGAPAHLHENFTIDLARSEAPNLLMVGNNLDKADAMFTLALLSLCINYRVQHGCAPEKPIAYLLNCQPAADRMLTHLSNLARQSPLSRYICVVDKDSAAEVFQKLLDNRTSTSEDENYVLVFGYHQAIAANLQRCNIGGILESLLKNSQHKGIHLVMWHNNYQTLQEGGFSLTSFFGKKIAFDVEPDHNSGRVQHFLNENDIAQMHGRNAVYFCNHEKQWFVPYQISSTDWLNAVVGKLQ